jgi:stage V sporulation protein S
MREVSRAEVQAIGAGAVNQALKAIVIAKGYLAEEGVDIVCVPSFVEVSIDDQERTAVRILVEPRNQA